MTIQPDRSDFSIEHRFQMHLTAEEERCYRQLWREVLSEMLKCAFRLDSDVTPTEQSVARSYLLRSKNHDRDEILDMAGFCPDLWRERAIPNLEALFSQDKTYTKRRGRGVKSKPKEPKGISQLIFDVLEFRIQ